MKKNELHTILGASGAIGQSVIAELKDKGMLIRAVGRQSKYGNEESVSADLLSQTDTEKAIKGSEFVYLCIGLEYKAEVWKRDWPIVMKNVIEACAKNKAVLIFLDNVYMYGPAPLSIPFDESHSCNPATGKGRVRQEIASMLLSEIKDGNVKGLIARSADFLGPRATNSVFYVSFLERMLKGKAPQSFLFPNVKHTYANTIDLGKALVALAGDERCLGQVWHLPVGDPISVEEMNELFNDVMGTSYRVSFVSPFMQKVIALMMPILKEFIEMLYQFKDEYIMSDAKFRNHFLDFKFTPYKEVVRAMVDSFRK